MHGQNLSFSGCLAVAPVEFEHQDGVVSIVIEGLESGSCQAFGADDVGFAVGVEEYARIDAKYVGKAHGVAPFAFEWIIGGHEKVADASDYRIYYVEESVAGVVGYLRGEDSHSDREVGNRHDNPRTENPESILDEMMAGLKPENMANVLRISDRRTAIQTACMIAQKGDIILIAGKGHENYQDVMGVKHHFDDKEIATEILQMQAAQQVNN